MPPEIIANRYRVQRSVGRGGMGEVWLCTDELLGREVAVKQVGVLPGESVPDLARALREARSSAALNHRHVVSVYDAVETDDHIWLVMEYVPGATLAELVAREGRLDPVRVATIGAQVADGLAAAHERGTVHRDVKPGNVLVGEGDVAKISDFGIARTSGDAQLTRSDLVIGSPLYFSPQLARGADPTPADDVWALGATLYAAVEGAPPTEDRGNPIATLAAVADGRPPRPGHAGFLTDAIGRMLDPDPASRWSMADAAHALERLHRQHRPADTLSAGPPGPPGPPGPADAYADPDTPAVEPAQDRRRRGPLPVALAVLLLAAVVVAAVLLGRDEEPAASPPADEPTSEAPTSSEPATPETAPTTEAPPSSEPASTTPPATTEGAAQAVADYYALLPEDTESAWAMIASSEQQDIGRDSFEGFWGGVSEVSVEGVESDGNVVTVDLVYNGEEPETRQLVMEETEGGWLIADDRGPV